MPLHFPGNGGSRHAPLQQQALSEAAYVSTGSLPPSEFVTDLVAEAHMFPEKCRVISRHADHVAINGAEHVDVSRSCCWSDARGNA